MKREFTLDINGVYFVKFEVDARFFIKYGYDYVGYYEAANKRFRGLFGTFYIPLFPLEKMAAIVRHESVHFCFDWFLRNQDWITETVEEEFAMLQDKIVDGFIERMK